MQTLPAEVQEVLGFASFAHRKQLRKYIEEPYIVHPIAVAKAVQSALGYAEYSREEAILATKVALLHDVVEDTDYTIEDIRELFGDEVARGVWFLTDADNFVGNRKTRKALTKARLALAPLYVKVIKRCDIEDNRVSIKKYDPDFYKVFEKETDNLLEVL